MAARWSEDRNERLRAMWNDGKSASEIAEELSRGAEYVSRNMVIGKAHRMGLPSRPSPIIRANPAEFGKG